jgi:23S rRNA (uracil1939-C5)-methyltransferase
VRIGADGDGVADLPDGGTAYIPFTLPGELVRATLTGRRGVAAALLEPSPARAEPACPHFGACGGCSLQHWRDDDYAGWKVAQVEAALRRAGFDSVPMLPLRRTPPGARRRLDLALRRTPAGVVAGLHRARGEDVVDLDVCPVAHPRLAALIGPLRRWLATVSLLRREGSAIVNLLDTGPDLLLRSDAEPTAADRAGAAAFARAQGVRRVHWAKGNDPPEPLAVLGTARTAFAGVAVTPPPGGFLQASAEGEAAIRAAVLAGLPEPLLPRDRVVELYAGSGTLTFALAGRARVAAFEGDAAALDALRRAAPPGRVTATLRDLARQPLSARELVGAAAVVLDPPHAGAPAQIGAIAAARVARVLYVSCNPAALARDARVLRDAGYGLEAVTPVDQFLWSSRIESVCVLTLHA